MRITFASIAAVAGLFATPSLASTTVTWDETACGTSPCVARSAISQDFGDTPEVDLTYSGGLSYWPDSYSNSPAIYAASGSVGGIRLAPLSGISLLLLSVDFGGWPNLSREIAYSVFSDDLTQTLASGSVTTNPAALTTVNFNISSTSPIRFQFGPDAFNGGIQNLRFSTSAPAIPEPGTWILMILGLGGVGFAMRRRQQAALRFQFA